MDDSTEHSTVPKIIIEQTPTSSAHSDDSGLGGESNATMDGKFLSSVRSIFVISAFIKHTRKFN